MVHITVMYSFICLQHIIVVLYKMFLQKVSKYIFEKNYTNFHKCPCECSYHTYI